MIRALETRDLGKVCRLYREAFHPRLSQSALGSLVWMDQSEISEIENGKRRPHDIEVFERFRDGLDIPGHLLGLAPGPYEASSIDHPTEQERGEDPADRRKFLAGALLGALGATGPLRDLLAHPTPRQVGMAQALETQDLVRQLRALDAKFGGDQLWNLGASHLDRVHRMLNRSSYTLEVGRELQVATGELTWFVGWLSFDAGRQEQARHAYAEALSIAWLVEDEQLATQVLAIMSMQASQNRPREAIRLAEAAQEHAAGWATPRVRSLLAMREAEGYAAMGDASGFGRALIRAKQRFEKGPHDKDPEWLSFYTPRNFANCEGLCWTTLGLYDRAENLFREAVDQQDDYYQRNHASYLTNFATALFGQRDIGQAAGIATEALPLLGTVSSSRILERLGGLRQQLTRYTNVPEARDFTERFDALVAVRSRGEKGLGDRGDNAPPL